MASPADFHIKAHQILLQTTVPLSMSYANNYSESIICFSLVINVNCFPSLFNKTQMLLISAILLVLAQALNDIVITDRQTNLTVGASTVIACSYDSTGDFMLAASGTSLSLFNRDSTTLQFALNFSIAMPGLLKDAILSSDSTWVAAIINSNDTLNSTLYLLYRNSQ